MIVIFIRNPNTIAYYLPMKCLYYELILNHELEVVLVHVRKEELVVLYSTSLHTATLMMSYKVTAHFIEIIIIFLCVWVGKGGLEIDR